MFHNKQVAQEGHGNRKSEAVEPGKGIQQVYSENASYNSYVVRNW